MVRTAAVLVALSLAVPALHAEEPAAPPPAPSIRGSIEKVRFDLQPPYRPQPNSPTRAGGGGSRTRGHRARVVLGFAALGAVGGGFIGGATTSNCGCDDPGYGAFAGVSLGALVGAVVGAVLTSR